MRDGLLSYYERELAYLRQQGTAFARRYPKVAGRLELNPSHCEDPHVERLLEGVAFLAARVHLKLDDEYPEIAQALIGLVCPHLLQPLPSMSIARLRTAGSTGEVTAPVHCPRGQMMSAALPGGGTCQFQTAFDATIQPLTVAAAHWIAPNQLPAAVRVPGAAHALRLRLECGEGSQLSDLRLGSLRFFLNGTPSASYTLQEALLNRCLRVHARTIEDEPGATPWLTLGPGSLTPCGLEPAEMILPPVRRAFSGYQLLREYFAYPEKHLFVNLNGLDALHSRTKARAIEVVISFEPGEPAGWDHAIAAEIGPEMVLLDCVPVVNLFPMTADPIQLDAARYDYPLIPDLRQRGLVRVFSIEKVTVDGGIGEPPREIDSFHSHRHRYVSERERTPLYWHAVRRNRQAGDESSYWMSFHDLSGKKQIPDGGTVTVRCLCTNGSLPHSFSGAGEPVELLPVSTGPVRSAQLLRKPSPYVDPPLDGGILWRLVSHLSLNVLSLAEGPEPVQELLRLHAPAGPGAERQIAGIVGLKCSRQFSRVASEEGMSFARGIAIRLEVDEEAFTGSSAFLLTSVLERFFGAYVSVNAFTQLHVRSLQRREAVREWPARTGSTVLL